MKFSKWKVFSLKFERWWRRRTRSWIARCLFLWRHVYVLHVYTCSEHTTLLQGLHSGFVEMQWKRNRTLTLCFSFLFSLLLCLYSKSISLNKKNACIQLIFLGFFVCRINQAKLKTKHILFICCQSNCNYMAH